MSKTLTLLDLIADFQIIIPRIQRDYAQGRLSEKATVIRKSLVNTIVSTLDSENEEKNFNFVYGSTNSGVFIPLDGQQRLTTLFLVHLYLYWVTTDEQTSDRIDFKFSYVTRDSSTRFCRELIGYSDDLRIEIKEQYFCQRPSEVISNQEWFFPQWDADPTVDGMLVMLDEIHSRYFNSFTGDFGRINHAWKRLLEGALEFQFQSLNEFTRTDDLFIKMNSRGLDLTDFEIFKSKLVEDFEKKYPEKEKDFKLNVDGKWCDSLWLYRRRGTENSNDVDILYQRLLKFLIPAEAVAVGQEKLNQYADELFERNDKPMRFAHNAYEACSVVFSKELLERIYEDLDYLCRDQAILGSNNDFTKLLAGEQLSYDKTILAYAWLRFSLLQKDESEKGRWLRTIENLLKDSNVDSAPGLINAVKGVNSLLNSYVESNLGVYEWLASAEFPNIVGISSYQLQEEIVKAKLRLRQPVSWADAIEEAENDTFMDRQIGFLLESAGVAGLNYEGRFVLNELSLNEQEAALFESFVDYKKKAVAVFDNLNYDNDIIKEHLLVRALLKFGDYLIEDKSRRNIANHRNDRDYSWHVILNIGRGHRDSRMFFKELLDDGQFNPDDVKKSLEVIASRTIENAEPWRQILSGKYGHSILERAQRGFLHFQWGDNCMDVRILHTTQLNGFHDELYSLLLYFMLNEDPDCEEKIHYEAVKSGGDDATLVLHCADPGEVVRVCHWSDWKQKEWSFTYPDGHTEECSLPIDQILSKCKEILTAQ